MNKKPLILPRNTQSPACKDGDGCAQFSRRVLPHDHARGSVVRGLLLTILIATGLVGAVDCRCASASCELTRTASQHQSKSCHHETSKPLEGQQSGANCCGKCQLEKAVNSKPDISVLFVKSAVNTPDNQHFSFSAKNSEQSLTFNIRFYNPPADFWTEYVLAQTFSFRAPPKNSLI